MEQWLYSHTDTPAVIYNDGSEVADLAVSPQGDLLAIALKGSPNGRVRLWDPRQWQERGGWDLPKNYQGDLTMSPDGKFISFSLGDFFPDTKLADPLTGKFHVLLKGGLADYSPDGQTVTTLLISEATGLDEIIQWEAATATKIGPIYEQITSGLRVRVEDIAVSPDGKVLVMGITEENPAVILWDIAAKQVIRKMATVQSDQPTGWGADRSAHLPGWPPAGDA